MKKLPILFLLMLLAACNLPVQGNQAPAAELTATLGELTGGVQAKLPDADFVDAASGAVLPTGGQVKTLSDGRVRMDISDGSIVRVGPDSLFTLQSSEKPMAFRLDLGELWIILNGGQIDVETPSGLASVRGSYMHVRIGEANDLFLTCLEGDCRLQNEGGEVRLVAGQTARVSNTKLAPEVGRMTQEDVQRWLDINPEATVVIPVYTATSISLPPLDEPAPESTATPVPTATPEPTATPQPTATPEPTPTPQAFAPAVPLGPNKEDFPQGYNPLTGQPVSNPDQLDLPAVLISISKFPPSARPAAGISFAPFVYEIYIGTDSGTRLLTVFYGDYPTVEPVAVGDCPVRMEPFEQTETLLGNWVWFDANNNGIQDTGERGVAGVCVNLLDASGTLLERTTTDSNGFYAFNARAGAAYQIEVVKPVGYEFSPQNIGYEDFDSDPAQSDGRTAVFTLTADDSTWDAGLYTAVLPEYTPQPTSGGQGGGENIPFTPPIDTGGGQPVAGVGPIRSVRVSYADVQDFYPSSCIVAASGDAQVKQEVRGCTSVFGSDESDINSAIIDVTQLRSVAESSVFPGREVNYSGNAFTPSAPAGGSPAARLLMFYSLYNQTLWRYDAASGMYQRFDDQARGDGTFISDVERLSGRQLLFSNVVVLFAEHQARTSTIVDVNLGQGLQGRAVIFRNGKAYEAYWRTFGGEYERATGLRRPIMFVDAAGNPFPLMPGSTWVHVVSLQSYIQAESEGWRARFLAPAVP